MKKIILFAVFGVLFAPLLSFAQEEDQTLEYHPSAWQKPSMGMVNKMMPLKPEMPNFSGDAAESSVPTTSVETSFPSAEMANLKQQIDAIDQKLQALRAEKEAIMQKMKALKPVWKEEKKEMKKEIKEEWKQNLPPQYMEKKMPFVNPPQSDNTQGGAAGGGFGTVNKSNEMFKMQEQPPMMPTITTEEAIPTPVTATAPMMENKPMEMKTPRMGFTPFQWKKDIKKALSTTPEFQVTPKMLQQSIIRPSLSADQQEARHRQADAKNKLMKLRKIAE